MPHSLTQQTSKLWVSQSDFYFTNCGIFIHDGQAYVIDPGIFPKEIEAIANFLSEKGVTSQVIVLTTVIGIICWGQNIFQMST